MFFIFFFLIELEMTSANQWINDSEVYAYEHCVTTWREGTLPAQLIFCYWLMKMRRHAAYKVLLTFIATEFIRNSFLTN